MIIKYEKFSINENNEQKISQKLLKTILWDKGWNLYSKKESELRKLLNEGYMSVSNLSKDINEKDLKDLSDKLSELSEEMENVIKFMKNK